MNVNKNINPYWRSEDAERLKRTQKKLTQNGSEVKNIKMFARNFKKSEEQ